MVFSRELLLHVILPFARLQPVNLLLSTYWTMGAVRHGEYVAKVRVAPGKESAEKVVRRLLDPTSAPDIYRPALVAELKERPYEFELQVQLCVDLEKMPIEDLTVEWPEQLSPFVTVAKVRLPQQDIGGTTITSLGCLLRLRNLYLTSAIPLCLTML